MNPEATPHTGANEEYVKGRWGSYPERLEHFEKHLSPAALSVYLTRWRSTVTEFLTPCRGCPDGSTKHDLHRVAAFCQFLVKKAPLSEEGKLHLSWEIKFAYLFNKLVEQGMIGLGVLGDAVRMDLAWGKIRVGAPHLERANQDGPCEIFRPGKLVVVPTDGEFAEIKDRETMLMLYCFPSAQFTGCDPEPLRKKFNAILENEAFIVEGGQPNGDWSNLPAA